MAEDSARNRLGKENETGGVDIAVIRFPDRSNSVNFAESANFTGFSSISGAAVRYVECVVELGHPDMVILPETENTVSSLLWMRQNGLEASIVKLADQQTPIWGICGGYQMMGEELEDPFGTEREIGQSIAGLGLLPVKTVFQKEQTKTQVEGAFSVVEGVFAPLSGKAFSGCEIHMGKTSVNRPDGPADTARFFHGSLEICRPLCYLMAAQGSSKQMHEEGWGRGSIYGCCVHGIFGQEGIAEIIVHELRKKKVTV